MSIIVQKFGGTSVANVDRIKKVAEIIKNERELGQQAVIVISAMAGATDNLLKLTNEIGIDPTQANIAREIDALLASGESVSASLLALALQKIGIRACSYQSWQIPIITDNQYNDATILKVDTQELYACLQNGIVPVVCGFQGVCDNSITTLGRGGSDTTAVALAAALKADVCDIYTDVDGVYSIDPYNFRNAKKIDYISYDEMLDMAQAGAKVMHCKAVEIGKAHNVHIRVRSTFTYPSEGTIIHEGLDNRHNPQITAVTMDGKVKPVKITLTGYEIQHYNPYIEKLFEIPKFRGIKVIRSSVSDTSISFLVADEGHELTQSLHDLLIA